MPSREENQKAANKLAGVIRDLEDTGYQVWVEGSSIRVNGVEIHAPNGPGQEWQTVERKGTT